MLESNLNTSCKCPPQVSKHDSIHSWHQKRTQSKIYWKTHNWLNNHSFLQTHSWLTAASSDIFKCKAQEEMQPQQQQNVTAIKFNNQLLFTENCASSIPWHNLWATICPSSSSPEYLLPKQILPGQKKNIISISTKTKKKKLILIWYPEFYCKESHSSW